MKYKNFCFYLSFALITFLSFVSCKSIKVVYADPTSATPISTDFGSNDLQQIASAMVDSMLTFPPIVQLTKNRQPIIQVARVNNKTMQHIDTQAITDSIRIKLLKSGKFRFTDRSSDNEAIKEIMEQNQGLLNNKKTATKFGQGYNAEYLLVSNLSEIKQKGDGIIDVFYKFTMSLRDLKTGLLVWSDEKEIRKQAIEE